MQFKRISKSLLSTATMCAWKAHAHHNLGHKSTPNPAARLGIETHAAWAAYNSGTKPLAEIRAGLAEDVAALFNMAVASDTTKLSDIQCEIKLTSEIDGAKIIAIIDRLGYNDARTLFVEDLKTSYEQSDDPFERHLYVYLANKTHPSKLIIFSRFYARSGLRTDYAYLRLDDDQFEVTTPEGYVEEVDLAAEVRAAVQTMIDLEPAPNVGSHCKNWYGAPCQFYQNLCPATSLEISTVTAVTQASSNSEAEAARELLFSNDPLSLPAETVATALNGINKLKEGCKTVEKIIKTWSDAHGQVVTPDGVWAWQDIETPDIDNYAALLHMFLRHIPIEAIAKAVNISATSLKKIPGQYRGMVDEITSAASETRKTRRFQRLD